MTATARHWLLYLILGLAWSQPGCQRAHLVPEYCRPSSVPSPVRKEAHRGADRPTPRRLPLVPVERAKEPSKNGRLSVDNTIERAGVPGPQERAAGSGPSSVPSPVRKEAHRGADGSPRRLPLVRVVPVESAKTPEPRRNAADLPKPYVRTAAPIESPAAAAVEPIARESERSHSSAPETGQGRGFNSPGRSRGHTSGTAPAPLFNNVTREAVKGHAPDLLAVAVPALLVGLGVTFPPALAVIGGRVALGIYRRRKQRKAGAAAAPEFQGLPRDDPEAVQFLQLSAREGRSPVRDALVGRLAFDELDNVIDSGTDRPQADWARTLKRTLETRVNDMAPLAVFSATGKTP